MRLANKVAIITGAGSGIGQHASQVFAQQGAKVVVTDIHEDNGKATAQAVIDAGGEAIFLKLDVTNQQNWGEVVQQTLAKFGKIDILINSAGISISDNVLNTTIDDLRKSFALNVEGPFLGIQAVAEPMKQNGGGSIVNIASLAGVSGLAYGCAYSTSKGAVRLLSKSAGVYFAKAGTKIRVNNLNPTFIRTPMLESACTPERIKELESFVPANRLCTLEDVSESLVYLASDGSAFMTGFDFNLDGGYLAGY